MLLTVLGCSGSLPGPGNPCSCYLVQHGDDALLLDLGTGSVGAALEAVRLPPGNVSAARAARPTASTGGDVAGRPRPGLRGVIVSHLHGDHAGDVHSLAYAMGKQAQWLGSPPGSVPVVAPGDLADAFPPDLADRSTRGLEAPAPGPVPVVAPGDLADALPPDLADRPPPWLHASPSRREPRSFGALTVRQAPGRHQVPSWATRVSAGGRSLVYTGDTGPCDAVLELARGADVLLCEAALAHPEGNGAADPCATHLTPADAGRLASAAGCALLVLTHLRPWSDHELAAAQAAARFAGPVVLASPGLRLAV